MSGELDLTSLVMGRSCGVWDQDGDGLAAFMC